MNRTMVWLMSFVAAAATFVMVGYYMGWGTVNYLLLVGLVLFHGFYGLHTMLTEFWTGGSARLAATGLCLVLGVSLFCLALLTSLTPWE